VENQFDTYKNVLNADRMYLQDDESVFGHLFTSFLALYGYCKLDVALKDAGLLRKSPLWTCWKSFQRFISSRMESRK